MRAPGLGGGGDTGPEPPVAAADVRSPQAGGAAVLAVGVWTLAEKSGHLSVLASSTFAASAYILLGAGALVMVTGFLGFGAIVREDRGCLSTVSPLSPAPQRPARAPPTPSEKPTHEGVPGRT